MNIHAVLAMALAAVSVSALEPVPVNNASFEEAAARAAGPAGEGWQTDGSPPGWHHWIGSTARAGKPVLSWERGTAHSGQRSVSLAGCLGPVCVIQDVPVEPNTAYLVRAWARRSSPESVCSLQVRWHDAQGKWVGGTLQNNLPADLTSDAWYELEVPATAPKDAAFAVILLTADRQGETGRCWFDDVTVHRYGRDDVVITPCNWMDPLLFPEGEPPVTPHVEWARPWAGGRMRALFLLGSDHSLREQVELAERGDLEYDYTFAHDREPALYALDSKQVSARLEGGAYQVAVVAVNAPAELTTALMGKLAPGGGLVMIAGPGNQPAPPDGWRLTKAPDEHYLNGATVALPEPAGGQSLLAGIELAERDGRRLVRLTWSKSFRCLTPNVEVAEHLAWGAEYHEGLLQTVLRAMLWAAHREPGAPLALKPVAGGAELRWTPRPEARWTVDSWTVDRLGRALGRRTQPAGKSGSIDVAPESAAGPAAVAVIVRDEQGRAVDFGLCRTARAAAAGLTAVTGAKDWFAPDEPVTVIVEVADPAGARLEVVLTDTHGREIARSDTPAAAGANAIALKARDHLSAVAQVTARLVRDGRELDAARGLVLRPLPRAPFLEEFQVGTWASTGYHPAYLHEAMLRAMRRAAITEGLESATVYLPTLAGGVRPVSTAYGGVPGFSRYEGPGTVREPCLSDPAVRRKMAETARQVATAEQGSAPIFGYIKDETSLVRDHLALDTCSSPHCQARYRVWLRERYGEIGKLNADWGTSYRSFDEPGFVDFKQARAAGNLAPWLMVRRFMDWVWADAVRWTAENARQGDPTVTCALANSFGQAPFSGRDYWLLAGANDYTMEYPYEAWSATPWTHHFDAVRSFSADKVHHPWIGYSHRVESIRYEPWWCLLHGASGVEIYGCMSLFAGKASWAQVFPTMQLTRRGRMFAEVCRPLQEGLGRAVMSARRAPAPVAILWSQPSFYAGFGLSSSDSHLDARNVPGPYRQYTMSRDAFRRAVIGSGRQFDYVCEEQIRDGALKGYRCLMLPGSFAVDADVAAAIEAFVRAGGRLIADQGAGLLKESGADWPGGGPLAGLLGIRRTGGRPSYVEAPVAVDLPGLGRLEAKVLGHEPLAAVPGAPAYDDGSPVAVAREVGQGRAVFLNFAAPEAADLRLLLTGLPRFGTITDGAGREAPPYEIVRLDRGELRYYGVLRDFRIEPDGGPVTLRLEDEQGRHLYDLRAGRDLGPVAEVPLALPPGETRLLATAPYRVEALELTAPARVRAASAVTVGLALRCSGRPGDHVLRVEVADPAGRMVEPYCRNVLAEAGRATVAVPLAPNDPRGRWTVTARDVVSGRRATASLEVGD